MAIDKFQAVRDAQALLTASLHDEDLRSLWCDLQAEQQAEHRDEWAMNVNSAFIGMTIELLDAICGGRPQAIAHYQTVLTARGADTQAFKDRYGNQP